MNFKHLKEQNNKILQQNDTILKELAQKSEAESHKFTETLMQPLAGFPINTIEEFAELNSDDNIDMRKIVFKHLIQMGGLKLRDFLNSSLREIMSDELVSKFSLRGGDHALRFGDTKVSNILYQAAQKCSLFRGTEDKIHFKLEMQEVMRTTKQRYRNLLKKVFKMNQNLYEDDEEALMKRITALEALQAKDTDEENLSDGSTFADDES